MIKLHEAFKPKEPGERDEQNLAFAHRSFEDHRKKKVGHDKAVEKAAKEHGCSTASLHEYVRRKLDATHGMSRQGYKDYRRDNS